MMYLTYMKSTSSLVKEIRCNRSFVFLRLGTYWYKYSMPSGVLGDMLVSISLGKYYNCFIKGNFGEKRVHWPEICRARTRILYIT